MFEAVLLQILSNPRPFSLHVFHCECTSCNAMHTAREHTHTHNNICKEQNVAVNEYVSTEYGIFGALKAKMRRDFVNLDVDVIVN